MSMELELTGDLTELDLQIRNQPGYTREDLALETGFTLALIDGELVTNFDVDKPPVIDIPTEPDPDDLPVYGRNGWDIETYDTDANLTQDQITRLVNDRAPFIFTDTHKPYNAKPFSESQFRFTSGFSHVSLADPTKNFGLPGAHLHTFFGATLPKNEHTTIDDLLNRGGSVNQGGLGNRTSYYTPTMLDAQGRAVVPFQCLIYYKTKQEKKYLSLIPQGQGLISGNLTTGLFAPSPKAHWGFYDGGMVRDRLGHIPRDNPKGLPWFNSVIQFQDLMVEGELEYGAAHKFSVNKPGVPPPDGYLQTYQMTMICFYQWEDDTPQWRLDSDILDVAGHSLHAEVRFGWNEALQQIWFDNCYRTNCSGGQLGIPDYRLNDFMPGNRHTHNLRIELTGHRAT